jgi:threonine dehydratase
MWRYREVMPVESDENIVSLGEGWTPLLPARRLGKKVGVHQLYIKDEGQNPTQSFKARGMAAAVRWPGVGREETGRPFRRKRRGRTRRLCRSSWFGVLHLHAARHAASERRRV